jgi:hypothetical protein
MFMLFATAGIALAQPVLPPAGLTGMTADERAEIKASVTTTKADEKTSRATREQIQALRLALRAKLAMLHH